MLTHLFSGNEKAKELSPAQQRTELIHQLNQWEVSNPEVARQMASILIHLLTHQFQLDPSAEDNTKPSNWTLPILQQK